MDRDKGKRTLAVEGLAAESEGPASDVKEDTPGKGKSMEDMALKEAARLFGQELMPLLGVRQKVRRIAPTEEIWVDPKGFRQDLNYEMDDGSWAHLEFESDSIKMEDLRRFHVYEAVTSYHHRVKLVTYVLCSSNVKKLRCQLDQGLYCYRVKVIRIQDKDAAVTIQVLEQEQKERELSREELLQLLLTPLMGGQMSQAERIVRSMQILRKEGAHRSYDEQLQMEAVLYTLAMKFLTVGELEKIKEEMEMTILGEMLEQKGFERGIGRINRLNEMLIKADRMDDLKRAVEDEAYQAELMRELLPEEGRIATHEWRR